MHVVWLQSHAAVRRATALGRVRALGQTHKDGKEGAHRLSIDAFGTAEGSQSPASACSDMLDLRPEAASCS